MNKFKEMSRALVARAEDENRLKKLLQKTVENIAAERAGAPAMHDDAEIYAEILKIKSRMDGKVAELTDEAALLKPDVFPVMKKDGELIKAGTRINWKGTLKRASVDLYDAVANSPDNAPNLWEDLIYEDEYRVIPETITAGTAFAKGEKGKWGDKIYESLIDNNVWTPAAHPSGWLEVDA
ncbi:MAG: hypothetical protein J6A60_02140 [Clostridia bacterium]|nr:hypothetical protein [Clostridia bacterium]